MVEQWNKRKGENAWLVELQHFSIFIIDSLLLWDLSLAPFLPPFPFLSFAVSEFWLHLGEIEIEIERDAASTEAQGATRGKERTGHESLSWLF